MRVIAGKARRILLKTIEGNDTRPTTDRIKETLFNILQPELYDVSFLDLFSGSGGIGIEALSRGAKEAVFVENNPKAVECIEENLAATKLKSNARVFSCDVLSAIRKMEGTEPFSIVFMDPPYKADCEEEVLKALAAGKIIDEDSIIIIEAALDKQLSFAKRIGFEITREKTYRTNKHIFLKYAGE